MLASIKPDVNDPASFAMISWENASLTFREFAITLLMKQNGNCVFLEACRQEMSNISMWRGPNIRLWSDMHSILSRLKAKGMDSKGTSAGHAPMGQ